MDPLLLPVDPHLVITMLRWVHIQVKEEEQDFRLLHHHLSLRHYPKDLHRVFQTLITQFLVVLLRHFLLLSSRMGWAGQDQVDQALCHPSDVVTALEQK